MDNISENDPGQKDLRVIRTGKALYDALFSMLSRRNFNAITVNALCSEAMISRAAFYAHYSDKYDLLKFLLSDIRKNIVKDVYNYDELEREINQFVFENKKVVANILIDANSETMGLMREFMSSIIESMIKRQIPNPSNPQRIILFNFIAGGLLSQLTWINENDFPPEVSMMNPYLYKMLEAVAIWDAEQDQNGNDAEN